MAIKGTDLHLHCWLVQVRPDIGTRLACPRRSKAFGKLCASAGPRQAKRDCHPGERGAVATVIRPYLEVLTANGLRDQEYDFPQMPKRNAYAAGRARAGILDQVSN